MVAGGNLAGREPGSRDGGGTLTNEIVRSDYAEWAAEVDNLLAHSAAVTHAEKVVAFMWGDWFNRGMDSFPVDAVAAAIPESNPDVEPATIRQWARIARCWPEDIREEFPSLGISHFRAALVADGGQWQVVTRESEAYGLMRQAQRIGLSVRQLEAEAKALLLEDSEREAVVPTYVGTGTPPPGNVIGRVSIITDEGESYRVPLIDTREDSDGHN